MLTSSPNSLLALAVLLTLAVTLAVIRFRLQRGGVPPTLRPFPAVAALHQLAERSIEEERNVHLALGSGRLLDTTAAETLVGLTVLNEVVEQGRRARRIPIVTTADAPSQLLATGILTQWQPERGWEAREAARFVGPQPSSYGAGTRGAMQRENLGLTAVVGSLHDEYLFLAAERPDGGRPMFAPEVAATARLETLPLLHLTARHALLGEDTFALGGYLFRQPSDFAGLIVQDLGRAVLGVAIIAGVVFTSLRAAGWL